MKAVAMHIAGPPSVLRVEQRPIPSAKEGQVLIRVHAAGLNRSELFTRQGHSPGLQYPRILGIEACGIVASAPNSTQFKEGDVVATAMGGMGRIFDGGYAEYTVVPAAQVQKLDVKAEDVGKTIGWDMLGAAPEMLQTAYGSLVDALRLQKGERLLVRGGTTSVGMAATAIAKSMFEDVQVMSTTRSKSREDMLKDYGADVVIVDSGTVKDSVREYWPDGADKVLELIGVTTLDDSLQATKAGGVCCMTGIVGNKWSYDEYNPMEHIPKGVYLTAYGGGPDEFMKTPLNEMVNAMVEGRMKIPIGKRFTLDQAIEAHEIMEANKAGGKVVFLME
ncbi:GroES-like protein [Polyplosphaeria fusca]|uniref:GroES-like protein n=1 Tax=Polyplosphaeria fusca TaxID=682080 RepID=A0A9P4V7D4_9PLEO|nr:GroES-like protein [Polyplosphaeria fusca]